MPATEDAQPVSEQGLDVTLEITDGRRRLRAPDGPYQEFAQEMRRLMGATGERGREFLTAREAAARTGVHHSTISEALRGTRQSEVTLLRIAKGLDGDPALLLHLNDYAPLVFGKFTDGGGDMTPDEEELVTISRSLPPSRQSVLMAMARAVRDAPAA